jgi:hypothetical protein
MAVTMYKCRQCGKIVNVDELFDNANIESNYWFDIFSNCLCSNKCFIERERIFKSLTA